MQRANRHTPEESEASIPTSPSRRWQRASSYILATVRFHSLYGEAGLRGDDAFHTPAFNIVGIRANCSAFDSTALRSDDRFTFGTMTRLR